VRRDLMDPSNNRFKHCIYMYAGTSDMTQWGGLAIPRKACMA
jgi:hypothetical protein